MSRRSTRRSRTGAARPVSTPRALQLAESTVYSYGNSELRGGITQLSPKQGVSLGDAGAGWSHSVFTVTPGIPGDSGSAFLDATGKALGILSTVASRRSRAGTASVTSVAVGYAYMPISPFTSVQLATGTEPFNGNQLPPAGPEQPGAERREVPVIRRGLRV